MKVPMDQFDEAFTGIVITLAPTEMQQIAALDRQQSFENWY